MKKEFSKYVSVYAPNPIDNVQDFHISPGGEYVVTSNLQKAIGLSRIGVVECLKLHNNDIGITYKKHGSTVFGNGVMRFGKQVFISEDGKKLFATNDPSFIATFVLKWDEDKEDWADSDYVVIIPDEELSIDYTSSNLIVSPNLGTLSVDLSNKKIARTAIYKLGTEKDPIVISRDVLDRVSKEYYLDRVNSLTASNQLIQEYVGCNDGLTASVLKDFPNPKGYDHRLELNVIVNDIPKTSLFYMQRLDFKILGSSRDLRTIVASSNMELMVDDEISYDVGVYVFDEDYDTYNYHGLFFSTNPEHTGKVTVSSCGKYAVVTEYQHNLDETWVEIVKINELEDYEVTCRKFVKGNIVKAYIEPIKDIEELKLLMMLSDTNMLISEILEDKSDVKTG